MCEANRSHREEADEDVNPWNAAIQWGLWLRFEQRFFVSHDSNFLRFAATFFTQYCFGCGADLELESKHFPNALCGHCYTTQAWRLN